MKNRRRMENIWSIFLVLLVLGCGLLAILLWQGEKKEEGNWDFLVFAEKGEMSLNLYEQMRELPGLFSAFDICKGEIKLQIENYETTALVYGIDLEQAPLQISHSMGKVVYGDQFLLVLGNGSLDNMVDENEMKITKRKIQTFFSLGNELSIKGNDREGKLLGISGTNKLPDTGIYGVYEEILDLLKGEKTEYKRGLWLRVSGKENAGSVRETLETAGFLDWSEWQTKEEDI